MRGKGGRAGFGEGLEEGFWGGFGVVWTLCGRETATRRARILYPENVFI